MKNFPFTFFILIMQIISIGDKHSFSRIVAGKSSDHFNCP